MKTTPEIEALLQDIHKAPEEPVEAVQYEKLGRLVSALYSPPQKEEPWDPEVVSLVQIRAGWTDHYGQDLLALLLHDLNSRECVERRMPHLSEAARKFRAMAHEKQVKLVNDLHPDTREDDPRFSPY